MSKVMKIFIDIDLVISDGYLLNGDVLVIGNGALPGDGGASGTVWSLQWDIMVPIMESSYLLKHLLMEIIIWGITFIRVI